MFVRIWIALFFMGLASSGYSQTYECPKHTEIPDQPANVVVQEFISERGDATTWRITYGHGTAKGLYLTNAYFKPGPEADWVKFVDFAGLSDIFVPYASGDPETRYWDLTDFSFELVELSSDDVGPCGKIIGDGFVAREVRDSGLLWVNDYDSFRSTDLVLWGVLDALNYNYIISYTFKADGIIEFRLAGTAANLPGSEWETHAHNGLWQIDLDLNGKDGDTAYLTRYIEPDGSKASENQRKLVGNGKEAGVDWLAREYTTLQVEDADLVNRLGQRVTLDFRPLFRGSGPHFETVTEKEFYVTRKGGEGEDSKYRYFDEFLNNESIEQTDITVWLKSPILHVPRSEDGWCDGTMIEDGCFGTWVGAALAMWGGFDLRPRNLFVGTPFYHPPGE